MVYSFNFTSKKSLIMELKETAGISQTTSYGVCKKLGFNVYTKVNELTQKDIFMLIHTVNFYKNLIILDELKKKHYDDIDKLKKINSYKGLRHKLNLPVRGQRTKTNAKTQKKKNRKKNKRSNNKKKINN